MNAEQLSQLILHMADQVAELGGDTTTLRLVKLLYLIDLEHWRRLGLPWQRNVIRSEVYWPTRVTRKDYPS